MRLVQRAARRHYRLADIALLATAVTASVLATRIYAVFAGFEPPPIGEQVPLAWVIAFWPLMVVVTGAFSYILFRDDAEYFEDLAHQYAAKTDLGVRRRWARDEHQRLERLLATHERLSGEDLESLQSLEAELAE